MKWSMAKWLLLAVCLLTSLAAAAPQGSYKEETRDGIHVRSSCIMPKALSRGYVPVQLYIENRRKEKVSLDLELGNLSSWDDRSYTSGTVNLDAGAGTTLDWLVYAMPSSHSFDRISLRVKEGTRYVMRHTALQLDSSSASRNMEATLVASDDPSTDASRINGIGVFGSRQLRAEGCLPNDLPTDWRAYTALRVVVFQLESKAPPNASIEAILDWVATGGILVLIGEQSQAEQLMAAHGDVLHASRILSGDQTDVAPRRVYRHHFGRIVTQGDHEGAGAKPEDYFYAMGWNTPAAISNRNPPEGTFPAKILKWALEIPGLRSTPVALLILVLIVFAVLVGPWQLRRQKRKQASPFRFLLTTPLLGFGFTAFILLASLLSQGVDVKESAVSVTWLDQQSHKASTLGKRLTFSGSVFRNRLNYSARAVAAPYPDGTSSTNSKEYVINMDRNGALEGHFLPVRMPTEQLVACVANARGRVEVEEENGVLYAINGLDIELQDFYYLDRNNQWHEVDGGSEIVPGERAKLETTEAIPDFRFPSLPHITQHTVKSGEEDLPITHLPAFRPPVRSYVANIPNSPFLEDGGVDRNVGLQAHMLIGSLPPEEGR